jgi:hypothetical protein
LALAFNWDGFTQIVSLNGTTCGPEMHYVPTLATPQICHWDHEIAVYVLSICTQVLAIALLVLWFLATIKLAWFVIRLEKEIIDPERINHSFHHIHKQPGGGHH